MALAPTLLKFLNVSVGVGAIALTGLSATVEAGVRAPDRATLAIAGNQPTIAVQLGPTSDADVGLLIMHGREPFLLRELVIAPGLPDSAPEQNDLTPTLVWQDTLLPTKAILTLGGLAPAVVGDTGQSIALPVGSAVIVGLAPTLDLPAGQSGVTEPSRIACQILGLEPSLMLELTTEIAAPELLALVGLAPTLSLQVGWESVPTAQGQSWTDVPRV